MGGERFLTAQAERARASRKGKLETRRQKLEMGGERFLTAQADRFAGAKRKKKVGSLRSEWPAFEVRGGSHWPRQG